MLRASYVGARSCRASRALDGTLKLTHLLVLASRRPTHDTLSAEQGASPFVFRARRNSAS